MVMAVRRERDGVAAFRGLTENRIDPKFGQQPSAWQLSGGKFSD
jgi:hypothetical protein